MGDKAVEEVIKSLLDKGLTKEEIKDLFHSTSSGISIEVFNKLFPESS